MKEYGAKLPDEHEIKKVFLKQIYDTLAKLEIIDKKINDSLIKYNNCI